MIWDSLWKNRKGIALVLCSALLVCLGQLCWKMVSVYGAGAIAAGVGCYLLGSVFMIWAYRFGELSVLQPMLSMNYILAVLLGVWVLGEALTLQKVMGIAVISAGVLLIGGGSDAD